MIITIYAERRRDIARHRSERAQLELREREQLTLITFDKIIVRKIKILSIASHSAAGGNRLRHLWP